MKKFLVWALLALPVFAACGDKEKTSEEGGSTDVTMSNLVGEWFMNFTDESSQTEHTLIIKSDGSFIEDEVESYDYDGTMLVGYQTHFEGKYKLNGNKLTGEITKAQYKEAKWEGGRYVGLTDWQDITFEGETSYSIVTLLKNGAVMMIEYAFDDEDDYQSSSKDINFYFKKGAKLPSDKSELQGTWFWYDSPRKGGDEKVVRVAVKFDGDNIDLIVAPWSQRFICKYNYKDGIVSSVGEVTFRTLWREDGANEMNWQNPYDSEWLPSYDPEQYTGNLSDGFAFPFIVDGKTAYSLFVGLSPVYTKQ